MTATLLYCATANAAKLREFQSAAGEEVEVRGLPPCSCPEHGLSFEENAVAKALCYSRCYELRQQEGQEPLLVFADDSGIVVDHLHGGPGIHSARFAGTDADDEANNRLLLEKLAGVPEAQRTARFVCWIALVRGSVVLKTFQGVTEGRILNEPSGAGGFGYDPLFFYPPLGKSFAQLSAEAKWEHSHRGKAFRTLLEWLGASRYSTSSSRSR